MEKILLAIDLNHVNAVSLDFACWLAKLTNSKLTGVFLEEVQNISKQPIKTLAGMHSAETLISGNFPETEIRTRKCDESIRVFEERCKRKAVRFAIHHEGGEPFEEIICESRFGDLLVIDPEMSLDSMGGGVSRQFIENILRKTECPVILPTTGIEDIDEVILAYDGSASSVFAIKQFTYLLPELSDKRVIIVQTQKSDISFFIQRDKIGELLQPHYSSVGFDTLYGDPDEALFEYMAGKRNAFLVMGTYGRALLSRTFRRSTAMLLIRTLNLPIFIAHH